MKIEIEIGENLYQLLKGRDNDTVYQLLKDTFENVCSNADKFKENIWGNRKGLKVDGVNKR